MAPKAWFSEMVEAQFPVVHSDSSALAEMGTVVGIGRGGVVIRLQKAPLGRYSWLEFCLPGTGYRVKALGEQAEVVQDYGAYWIFFRFKHVFPRDRAALSDFIATRAAA